MTLILWAALLLTFYLWPILLFLAVPLFLFYMFSGWHFATEDQNPDH